MNLNAANNVVVAQCNLQLIKYNNGLKDLERQRKPSAAKVWDGMAQRQAEKGHCSDINLTVVCCGIPILIAHV